MGTTLERQVLATQSWTSRMIKVVRYNPEHRRTWDDFISNSKNGVFLFYRNYMEYHSDRFRDHSLLFFTDEKPIALMPANARDNNLYSHEGLTFGGIISGYDMKTPLMMEIFEELVEYLKGENIKRIVYKAIPHIYHAVPAEEDLYVLFRYNAKLVRRDVTSSIYLPAKPKFQENKVRTIKRALKNRIFVKKSDDFSTYMRIVKQVLMERHGVRPVHSCEEIAMLAARFPDNIKLFASYRGDTMLAGVIIYESTNVAHAQYIANSPEGMRLGALDIVFDYLINEYYNEKRYFDFGISTENEGRFLNNGLIDYKEDFGARAIAHDFYEVSI